MRKAVCIQNIVSYKGDIKVCKDNIYLLKYYSWVNVYDRYKEWNVNNLLGEFICSIDDDEFYKYFIFMEDFRNNRINEIVND